MFNVGELLYAKMQEETFIAFWENGEMVEAHQYSTRNNSFVGGVYKGRVDRYVPGMEAAFIDIGLDKKGFLPLEKEADGKVKPLQSGQEILVQVKKDPVKEKGAFLSQEISLPGQYLLYMPTRQWVGISKRIIEPEQKRILQETGRKLITNPPEGVVMRGAALQADFKTLKEEKTVLASTWEEIQTVYRNINAPALLYKAGDVLDEILRDYGNRRIGRIITNDGAFDNRNFIVTYQQDVKNEVQSAQKELEKNLRRKVWLPSGGTLVFDFCEALTVIDVNTGKFTGRKALENTVVKTNMEACREIGRQLRLRNIGGIVIIDFIDMEDIAHQQEVEAFLGEVLKNDRVKTVIHGYTRLGLMEMTRKKTRNPHTENENSH